MTSLTTLKATRTFKGLAIGFPGTAKTGALASLANAGYRIGILDFDRNIDPLLEYVEDKYAENVSVMQLSEDWVSKKFTVGKNTVEKIVPRGAPTAYNRAMRLLDHWKDDEIDWGPVKSWGSNDVLVLDSLTSMGASAMLLIAAMNNRLAKGPRQNDWGLAQAAQTALLEMCKVLPCHVYVTAHLKIIEPKFINDLTDDDTVEELAATVKKAMESVVGLVPTRLYPSALGRALPPEIGKMFPFILRFSTKMLGSVAKRKILLTPSEECDIKVPLRIKEKELDIEDGLLKIFEMVRKGEG